MMMPSGTDNHAAEEANRRLWDELTPVHYRAYPVKEFLAGASTLRRVELDEVGNVKGRALLHLQCHFGLDTLCWARLGAEVTGVDFSGTSVNHARRLAREVGIRARFIRSSVYELPGDLDDRFDIVYTGIGVLCWLRDLEAWGRAISRALKPGGFFYIYEAHPFIHIFDDGNRDTLVPRYPYFHRDEPMVFDDDGPDYADPGYRPRNPSHEWQWTLGDVVNALVRAGLAIEFLHEHAAMPYPWNPAMEQREDGLWFLPGHEGGLPLAFSLRARR